VLYVPLHHLYLSCLFFLLSHSLTNYEETFSIFAPLLYKLCELRIVNIFLSSLHDPNILLPTYFVQEEGRSTLVLTNALKKDEDQFFCVVENAAGTTEANFTLEIVPPLPFPDLDGTYVLIIALAVSLILILLLAICVLFYYRRRGRAAKAPATLASSTPQKPPRLSYEINPGTLVANGFKTSGSSSANHHNKGEVNPTDNPDLIMETNNSSTYQVRRF